MAKISKTFNEWLEDYTTEYDLNQKWVDVNKPALLSAYYEGAKYGQESFPEKRSLLELRRRLNILMKHASSSWNISEEQIERIYFFNKGYFG